MPPTLQDLPARLKMYATSTPTDVPADSLRCYTCWRNFNTKDDPSSPFEIPCQPLQVQPCGHLVGDWCLARLIREGMTNCQLCRQPIDAYCPVPRWIIYLLSCDKFPLSPTRWILFTRRNVKKIHGKDGVREFDHLQQKLFSGKLDARNGMHLFLFYIEWPIIWTLVALYWAIILHIPFLILEYILSRCPSTSTWTFTMYAKLLTGKDCGPVIPVLNVAILSILLIGLRNPKLKTTYLQKTLVAVAFRNFTRIVPLKFALLLLTGPFCLLVVMVGILVTLGVTRRKDLVVKTY